MCLPAAAAAYAMYASLAMTAVSSVIQYSNQSAQAKAQEASIQKSVEANNAQLKGVYEQNDQQAKQEQSQYAIRALQEMGQLNAISAESGLQGATEQRLKNDVENVAADNMATIEANRVKANEQGRIGGTNSNMQAAFQKASINQPSALGTGLQIAGSALSAYATYDKTKPVTPK